MDTTTGQDLAAAGEQIEAAELNAAQAALSAAASEVISEINAEEAQAAARVATAAALDTGKLQAILEGIGRIEGHMAMMTAPVIQEVTAAPEDTAEAVAEAVADVVADLPEAEPETDAAPDEGAMEVESAGGPPPGRKRKPGLMRRKRGGRGE